MRSFLFLLFLFSIPLSVSAQLREDFRAWGSLSWGAELSKRWTLQLDQEVRFEDNAEVLGRTFSAISFRYKISRVFRLQAHYRFIKDKDERWWGNRNRFMFDVVMRDQQARWRYLTRSRIQAEKNGYGFLDENSDILRIYYRQMAKVNYRLNRIWEPYISAEARFMIQDARMPGYKGFERHRFTIGTDYNLSDKLRLGAFFREQQEWNRPINDRYWIVGLELNWNALF